MSDPFPKDEPAAAHEVAASHRAWPWPGCDHIARMPFTIIERKSGACEVVPLVDKRADTDETKTPEAACF